MSQHGCPERLSSRSKGFQDEAASQRTMEVLVETLTGTAFEMTVSPSDTIFAIKSKIFRVEGIPVYQQHLLYNLRELENSSSLRELAIGDGARLRLVLGMRGGPVATRRAGPPPAPVPAPAPAPAAWADIDGLGDGDRDDDDWPSPSCSGSGNGCKVTVVVFRDSDRVNVLHVRDNGNGICEPLHDQYIADEAPTQSEVVAAEAEVEAEVEADETRASGTVRDNAVTMTKMAELRRRMAGLALRRPRLARPPPAGENVDMQKTRSEETLSVAGLYEEARSGEASPPLGRYERYERYERERERPFAERYALLPPIGARAGAAPHSPHAPAPRPERAAAGPRLPATALAPISPALYGPVSCERGAWRARFGSSDELPAAGAGAETGAAGVGGAAGGVGARRRPRPGLAPFSSTPDLGALRRKPLPALSRHRNTEHLHLADERTPPAAPAPAPPADPAEDVELSCPRSRGREGGGERQ